MQGLPLFGKYKCTKKKHAEELCNSSISFNGKILYTTKHAAMYIGSGYHSFMVHIRRKCYLKVGTEQFKYIYK